jgi:hypothetical protein
MVACSSGWRRILATSASRYGRHFPLAKREFGDFLLEKGRKEACKALTCGKISRGFGSMLGVRRIFQRIRRS